MIWSTSDGGGGSNGRCISSVSKGEAGAGSRVKDVAPPTGGGSWPSCDAGNTWSLSLRPMHVHAGTWLALTNEYAHIHIFLSHHRIPP